MAASVRRAAHDKRATPLSLMQKTDSLPIHSRELSLFCFFFIRSNAVSERHFHLFRESRQAWHLVLSRIRHTRHRPANDNLIVTAQIHKPSCLL